MSNTIMRCKLRCTAIVPQPEFADKNYPHRTQVTFGAVWEGNTESQQQSENAIFGKMTPMAHIAMTLCNPDVIAKLKVDTQYYVDFSEAPLIQVLNINGKAFDYPNKWNNVTYETLRDLAGYRPDQRPTICWTTRRGSGGTLVPGDVVGLVPDQLFDVVITGNA